MKDRLIKLLKSITSIKGIIIALLCVAILYYLRLFLNSHSDQQLSSLTSIISIFISAIFVVYQVNKSHENAINEKLIFEKLKLQKSIKSSLSKDNLEKIELNNKYLALKESINHLVSLATSRNVFVGEKERQEVLNNILSNNEKPSYKNEKNDILNTAVNYKQSLYKLNSELGNIVTMIYVNDISGNEDNLINDLNQCRNLIVQQTNSTFDLEQYAIKFLDTDQSDVEMSKFIVAAKKVKQNNSSINTAIDKLINYKNKDQKYNK